MRYMVQSLSGLLNCRYELALLALRMSDYERFEDNLFQADMLDLQRRYAIIEERNDGHTATHGENGQFTGSEPYADGSKNSSGEKSDDNIVKTDDRFSIHPDKINKFLLKPGAKHSQEFFDVGYKKDDYEKLFDDIAKNYDFKKAVDFCPNDSDKKDTFSIFMDLGVTKQKSFRTVWEQSREKSSKPRLITAHREDR